MLIDIIFLIVLIVALFKGLNKGFIVAAFSIIGLMVGLAAAMKLSVVTAGYLKDTVNVSAKWLPVLSFIVVFIIAVLLVRLGAIAIEKMVDLVMLGWLNKIAGVILYLVLYIVIFSILLFYAHKINLISDAAIASSKTYPYIYPWGPKVMDMLGAIIPWFKNMFTELEGFFEHLATNASNKHK